MLWPISERNEGVVFGIIVLPSKAVQLSACLVASSFVLLYMYRVSQKSLSSLVSRVIEISSAVLLAASCWRYCIMKKFIILIDVWINMPRNTRLKTVYFQRSLLRNHTPVSYAHSISNKKLADFLSHPFFSLNTRQDTSGATKIDGRARPFT